MKRVTYIAAGSPSSLKTVGLVKVGQSAKPERRTRELATHLLGTTALGEGVLREMLRPYLVPVGEVLGRRLETGKLRGGEWYRDCPAVRMLVAWACEFRPAEDEG